MGSAIENRRQAIKAQIAGNPFPLTIESPTESTDAQGNKRYSGPYVVGTTGHDARVSFKTSQIPARIDGTPVRTPKDWFLLTDYQTVPAEKDRFTDGEDRRWEVQQVSMLSKFGGIIGYESEIIRINDA